MLYLAIVSIALSAGLVVAFLLESAPSRPREVGRRLAEIEVMVSSGDDLLERRRRQSRREGFTDFLAELGSRLPSSTTSDDALKQLLRQAGYDGPRAVVTFWGIRLGLTIGLGAFGGLLGTAAASPGLALLAALYGAAMGWVVPGILVRARRTRRQKSMRRALPDALDALVVCVEAGLGLNQAMVRVAQEIGAVNRDLGRELALTNLQIRAGTARSEALQDMADRTGLPDMQSLVTTLIQTDRFGTSVARSLRVHADTLRQKRRQEAEEAAAKTAIKMIFPLVICIFPALFVVLLAPGLIQIIEALSQV